MIYFLSFLFFFLLSCCSSTGFVFKTGILRLRTTSLSSTNIPSNRREATPHIYNGLLCGLLNISSAKYYSTNAPIHESAELVKNNRLLYDIIERECESDQSRIDEYLENMESNMDAFMEKNTVWDRKELLRGLDDIARKKGNFVCLLGGKSTGKSLVLKEFSLEKKKNSKVFCIDMRSGYPSITYGFLSVIKKSNNAKVIEFLLNLFKSLVAKVKMSQYIEIDFNAFLDIVKTEKDPTSILESLLDDITDNLYSGEVITLVVDEANIPLTINDNTSEAKIEQVKASLALFTRLTKQEKKVSASLD